MEEDRIKNLAVTAMCVLLALCMIAGIAFFLAYTRVEQVDYIGTEMYSDDTLHDKLFTHITDRNTYLFIMRIKLFGPPTLPFIDKIDVEMTGRNSVTVYLYDKAIIGCVEQMGSYIHFDREGRVIECCNERMPGIPEVRGQTFDKIVIGKVLQSDIPFFFEKIAAITQLLDRNGLDASVISFSSRNEVTLTIDDDKFLLGRRDTYDIQIDNIASVAAGAGEGAFRFDMREYDEDHREVTAKRIAY